MVRITIDSVKDDAGLSIYELLEGSSVADLKAEIEETEGIGIGYQRLFHNKQELRDDEKLDSLIFDDPLNAIIYLLDLDDTRCSALAPRGRFTAAFVVNRATRPEIPQELARAKYDWDGEIKHPTIKGLPLECHSSLYVSSISDQPGWLYGSIHELKSKSKFSSIFHKDRINDGEGYVPENFVSLVEQNEEDLEKVPPAPPPLPLFRFPPATGVQFRVPFSDKGHSFFKLTANYELTSSPIDHTPVILSLLCNTFGRRRVSSISIFITIPQTELLADVRISENEAHKKEIYTDKEVAEWSLEEKHSGGRLQRASHDYEGESSECLMGSIERGLNVARRKVEVAVLKEDTLFWNIKAPMTLLDEDGIQGEESITFSLTKKPVRFMYKCRVTHARDGVEKTTERTSKP